jgi:hypothetical protein
VSRGILAQVRDLTPMRPLTRSEALALAERQAVRLLALLGIHEPPVTYDAIASLPRLYITHMEPFPSAAAAHWSHGRWHIIINSSLSAEHQLLSLAHEIKHILDHPFVTTIFGGIDTARNAPAGSNTFVSISPSVY